MKLKGRTDFGNITDGNRSTLINGAQMTEVFNKIKAVYPKVNFTKPIVTINANDLANSGNLK
jgi:hypothetical protein